VGKKLVGGQLSSLLRAQEEPFSLCAISSSCLYVVGFVVVAAATTPYPVHILCVSPVPPPYPPTLLIPLSFHTQNRHTQWRQQQQLAVLQL
jgi:hypothetical protein